MGWDGRGRESSAMNAGRAVGGFVWELGEGWSGIIDGFCFGGGGVHDGWKCFSGMSITRKVRS